MRFYQDHSRHVAEPALQDVTSKRYQFLLAINSRPMYIHCLGICPLTVFCCGNRGTSIFPHQIFSSICSFQVDNPPPQESPNHDHRSSSVHKPTNVDLPRSLDSHNRAACRTMSIPLANSSIPHLALTRQILKPTAGHRPLASARRSARQIIVRAMDQASQPHSVLTMIPHFSTRIAEL